MDACLYMYRYLILLSACWLLLPHGFLSAYSERLKLVRIYGPELLHVEAAAIEGMMRMLNFLKTAHPASLQQCLMTSSSLSGGDEVTEDDDPEGFCMATDRDHRSDAGSTASTATFKPKVRSLSIRLDQPGLEYGDGGASSKTRRSSGGGGAEEDAAPTDLLLPIFVGRALEELRAAESPTGMWGLI
jgi:hypothetical protein